MGKVREYFALRVERLKGRVTEREYMDAIEVLKAIGGEVGAYAAMRVALFGGLLGASAAVGYIGASMGPVALGLTFGWRFLVSHSAIFLPRISSINGTTSSILRAGPLCRRQLHSGSRAQGCSGGGGS